jgi:hypothetical protein
MVDITPVAQATTEVIGRELNLSVIRKCIETIVLILRPYGLDANDYHIKESIEKTTIHWTSMIEICKCSWIKWVKYKLAAFYSTQQKQETLPEMPVPKVEIRTWIDDEYEVSIRKLDRPDRLLGGKLGMWLKSVLRLSSPTTRESILQSIKQSKKGMPRGSDEEAKQEEIKFIAHMTKERVPIEEKYLDLFTNPIITDWNEINELDVRIENQLNLKTCKEQIRRTVIELFHNQEFTLEDRLKMFFPSTSANYINNVKNAGAVGTILEDKTLMDGLRKEGGHLNITQKQREVEEKRLTTDEIIEMQLLGSRGYNKRREIEARQYPYTIGIEDQELKNNFQKLWFRILKRAGKELPMVKPVALKEALKFRMITKGPPFRMTVLRNHWKFIHSVLRKHPAFQLIGKPVDELYILNRMGANLKEDEYYLSGDYAAATDNLKSWASEETAKTLSDELRFEGIERKLFTEGLTQHLFENGKYQSIGQLMGSIVSFPVLCIINAAITRWAMELDQNKLIKLHDARLAINGDDLAAKGKKTLYTYWRKICAFFGLEESIGKTYLSRDFVDINSTSFMRVKEPKVLTDTRKDGTPVARLTYLVQTKYVNAGLLTGQKRSGANLNLNDLSSKHNNLSARAQELLRLAPSSMHKDLMHTFISSHRNILEKTRLPWFIPRWLGGVGLPMDPRWGEPSELDLRQAHKILLNWEQRRPHQLDKEEATWRTWIEAEKLLPEPFYQKEKSKDTEEYNNGVAQMCINLLFDTNYDLEKLHVLSEQYDGNKAIQYNAKLWKIGKGKLPKPLSLDEIKFQSKYPNWKSGSV